MPRQIPALFFFLFLTHFCCLSDPTAAAVASFLFLSPFVHDKTRENRGDAAAFFFLYLRIPMYALFITHLDCVSVDPQSDFDLL